HRGTRSRPRSLSLRRQAIDGRPRFALRRRHLESCGVGRAEPGTRFTPPKSRAVAGPWVLTVAGGASVGGARSAASASGMFRGPLHVSGEEENAMHAVIWVIAIVVVALVAFAAFYAAQRQRSRLLRTHFGPEYEQAVRGYGERRAAERALVERAERVK